MNPDYFVIPLIMNEMSSFSKMLKTGYYVIDIFLLLFFVVLYYDLNSAKSFFRRFYKNKLLPLIAGDVFYKISMSGTETARNGRSFRFRAVVHFLQQDKNNKTVRKLQELTDYDHYNDGEDIIQTSEYIVNQSEQFTLVREKGIYGRITQYSKEKHVYGGNKEFVDMCTLEIFSSQTDLPGLHSWLEGITCDYKKFLRAQCSERQLLITTFQRERNKMYKKNNSNGLGGSGGASLLSLEIEAIPWESTVTFANSYFADIDNVVRKIDFFLNNKDWYVKRGVPYNLGILLYGEPGCGKTRFIKQLLNHTKRHGICINLGEINDFNELNRVIFKEELDDEHIIPQDQRILILEDVDAMGDAVKKRTDATAAAAATAAATAVTAVTAATAAAATAKDNIMLELLKSTNDDKETQRKLNLSVILNALDGVHECTGRIVVMTTNHLEVLDNALTRAGRIDITIQFKRCTCYDISRLIQKFWQNEDDYDYYIDDDDDDGEEVLPELEGKYTAAEIINIFISIDKFSIVRDMFLRKKNLNK